MKHRIWILFAALAALVAVMFSIAKLHTPAPVGSAPAPKRIVCTTYPVFLFARAVAKDSPGVQPELLLPPDTGCPHDYALTPADLMKLSGANTLLLINGLGLDNALVRSVARANPALSIADTSEGIAALPSDAECHEEHDGHEEHEEHEEHGHAGHHHEHGESNPHLFASPDTASLVAANVAAALCRFDPENSALYTKNVETFRGELRSLEQEFKNADFKRKNIAVQHDVFAYLSRLCGLTEAVSLHAEEAQAPSPAEVAGLTKAIRAKKVAVLFSEPQYPGEFAALIAKESGIAHAVLDPAATGPENPSPAYYLDVMRKNLAVMKEALNP